MCIDFKKLKSGTDVRGVAIGDISPVTLTDGAIDCICRAFVLWLEKLGVHSPTIAVGNDSRLSAGRIFATVKNALLKSGANVVYTGLSSTPSMFLLLKHWGVDCSIMITASHMPYDRNGLKFFTNEGGISSGDLDEILSIAAAGNFADRDAGKYTEKSFMDEYSRILINKVTRECGEKPLKGKKIIVDAGNGAGGFFAEKVLAPLGADIAGSQFLEPDGAFPNHIPNPEDGEAIASLSLAVIKNGADLGIIFDTDVDRAACVDENGEEINRSALIAMISAILLSERAGTIVTDSVTNAHLTSFIESRGGKHLRFKRGYKNVIDKCRELNDSGEYSPLAIETSGHAAFKENYYLDDGAYLTVKLLISLAKQAKAGKTLSSLIADFKRPAEEREVRIGFNKNSLDFKSEGAGVIDSLKKIAASDKNLILADDNYEGVRIFFPEFKGLVLVRMSVHDPVMPINAESDISGGCRKILDGLLKLLRNFDFLDLRNLENINI